jgi:hypothetical protein
MGYWTSFDKGGPSPGMQADDALYHLRLFRDQVLRDATLASAFTAAGFQVGNAGITALAATKLTGNLTQTVAGSVKAGSTAIATTATDGFPYIPAAAGPPTGTPTAVSGMVPMYYDSTNDALYIFRGSNWRSVAVT